ncbi:MAG: 2-oxo acid dehydrogenase subunit E2, partial [Spirulina sp. SIO3F2]|nr:2-oxo acid dehydrogenase subunit E2 [Spirulina sp. SIO3F2]
MIRDIFMPALSSTMTEGKIVSWAKQPGDKVEKGETVVVVESDKADMDVESFHGGFLATILVNEGEEAPVGSAIALLAETEAEIEEAKAKGAASPQPAAAPAATESAPAAAPAPSSAAASAPTTARSGRLVASPRAKKLAKELKVDLAILQGTGPHGRIVAADVEQAAGRTSSTAVV